MEAYSLGILINIDLPIGANVISIDKSAQNHKAILTSLIDTSKREQLERRQFILLSIVVSTEIDEDKEELVYIGTFRTPTVIHAFEVKKK